MKQALLVLSVLFSSNLMASMTLETCDLGFQSFEVKECQSLYVSTLNDEIYKLDKSNQECPTQLENVKVLTERTDKFYRDATSSIESLTPEAGEIKHMNSAVLDLAYALNEDDGLHNCDYDQFVKIKADAQVKAIVLQDTTFID